MAGVTVAFDTLKAATRLQEEAGFDETKARVLVSTFAEGMVENLATKDDIAGLRRELTTLATKEELATLRGEMKQMDASLCGEMKQMDASLRGEISKVQERLTVRLGGAIAAAGGDTGCRRQAVVTQRTCIGDDGQSGRRSGGTGARRRQRRFRTAPPKSDSAHRSAA